MQAISYADIVLLILLLYAFFKIGQLLAWAKKQRAWIANKHGVPTPLNGDPPKPPGWP